MKKKIFVGLFASVLVCLAVVFTNASSNSFSVSGTVEVSIDGDIPQPMFGVSVQLTNSDGSTVIAEYETDSYGKFNVSNVSSNNRIRYSYSDEGGNTETQEKQYFEKTDTERITLHYQSHSSNN